MVTKQETLKKTEKEEKTALCLVSRNREIILKTKIALRREELCVCIQFNSSLEEQHDFRFHNYFNGNCGDNLRYVSSYRFVVNTNVPILQDLLKHENSSIYKLLKMQLFMFIYAMTQIVKFFVVDFFTSRLSVQTQQSAFALFVKICYHHICS